ncbi:MAG: GNAT family N-acetyltransferase [Limnochordia bacterium]|jgi:ribosomal protein S18 acetylase RimI-like enzyme|nr:GNAT family N-acetyltransferase [Limnochordia bacterium]MDI9464562.1 GNAT family N-acetyltransferase [Bacillota bacterium]NLO95984.1 GNAT family N-acetyltransferase [Bacillota bacterium]HOB39637.1 GNAT family N-acetyltransferase [Limnochordia bacterium]HOK30452.1 GNAT family N-acetyltransferase [Limnochordia bacterium]
MPDLLVKLYELPELEPLRRSLAEQGFTLRRGIPPERHIVLDWIQKHFNNHWADEAAVAFANKPSTIVLVVDENTKGVAGFACYEATYKAFFGPIGVHPDYRGKEIGRALTLAALHGLAELGYAYGIIGGAGPVEFYRKTVEVLEIPGSAPGIYRGMLRS